MEKVIDLRANGKLLITGEYLVLAGAKALALPLKFGQHLRAVPATHPLLHWSSFQPDGLWFECDIDPVSLQVITASDAGIAANLIHLLLAARDLNPEFLSEPGGYNVMTEANYPVEWGLGSSSTLVSMVARWAEVSAFKLFRLVSKGSGYDIACAERSSLLFYQLHGNKPEVAAEIPGLALRNHAFFAWLGKKQESSSEVKRFREKSNYSKTDLKRISELGTLIARADDASELSTLVNEHEEITGRVLAREPLGVRFSGFPGAVKSLGAWGGDFAMFVSSRNFDEVKNHLALHRITDVFTFDEIKATS